MALGNHGYCLGLRRDNEQQTCDGVPSYILPWGSLPSKMCIGNDLDVMLVR
jgi:hypothetical protein